MIRYSSAALVILLVHAAACSDSSGLPTNEQPPPPARRPVYLRIVSGDAQVGIVRQQLPEPVVLQVLDSADLGVPDRAVAFRVVAGGGKVLPDTGYTDGSGRVQVLWTLGPAAGQAQTVYARVVDTSGAAYVYASFIASALPPPPSPAGFRFKSVYTGTSESCGLTPEGKAYCWGSVVGDQFLHTTPVAFPSSLAFTVLALGFSHDCGLVADGTAYCWGENESGQRGDGTTSRRVSPVAVAGGLTFREIAVGVTHTCGVSLAGETYCWGDNGDRISGGQLGDGTMTSRPVPALVHGNLRLHLLALGASSSCGLDAGGAAYCWGARLGLHTGNNQLEPAAVGGSVTFETISLNFTHVCGLTAEATAYCWGSNLGGELGDGTLVGSPSPVPVAGGLRFSAIGAGGSHSCGLTLDGKLTC
jgi:hypothetical protein